MPDINVNQLNPDQRAVYEQLLDAANVRPEAGQVITVTIEGAGSVTVQN